MSDNNKPKTYPVPAVRLIITDATGKVLILKRANSSHSEGLWCLPGGKVDYGCTVEDTVRKELQEETALVCTTMKFLFYKDGLPEAPGKMHCIVLHFECSIKGAITLNEESSEYVWVGPNDIGGYEFAFSNDTAIKDYWRMKVEKPAK